MFMSFREVLSVAPGFQPNGVFTASVSLPEAQYPNDDARRQFTDELLREVRAIPGVQAAGVTNQLPFSGSNSSSVIFPEGYIPDPGESLLAPHRSQVGPEYFDALGIGLMEGRVFTESDTPDRTHVIVIDDWLANRYWPDSSPLGERMTWGALPGADSVSEDQIATVIGVVANIKQNDLTESAAEHVGSYYFTYRQDPTSFLTLVVRTATPSLEIAPEVRQVLSRIAPEMPLFGVQSMDDRIAESLVSRRVPLMLLLAFAGVALFLAVIGIYGALAYSVAQRTREIGIRLAMGSTLEDVFRLVVGQGFRVIGVGLVFGVISAMGLARLLQSLLFGIQSTDLRVMGVVAVTLAAVGLVACVVPARRATKVDPVSALTYQ
jgi:predicted permease